MLVLKYLRLLLILAPLFSFADSSHNNVDTLWSSIQVYEQLAAHASIQCRNHTRNMLDSLRNATFWAVQMVDSSANIPSGVLEGNIYNFGDFDECLSIYTGTIQGQYCLASLQIDGPKLDGLRSRPIQDARLRPDPYLNTWYYIQNRGERWRAFRNILKMAICVPKSCSHLDVQEAMKTVYNSISSVLNATVEVNISAKLCSTKEPLIISSLDLLFVFIVVVLAATAAGATLYCNLLHRRGLTRNEIPNAQKWLMCFDVKKNFLDLANVETKSETDLNFLFGIRFLAINMTISAHKNGDTFGGPTKNAIFQEQEYIKFTSMPILHGDLLVDTFFFLGGFLLTVGLLKVLKNLKANVNVSVWPLYLYRILRLTPAYLMTILFYVSLLPKIGSGPLWKIKVVPESEYCLENWWTNLLYINNYVHVERSCIIQGWYMPSDMHFFIVGVPLVMLLHRRPKIGGALLALFTFASILAPFHAIWMADADPMLLFFLDFLRKPRAYPYFSEFFVKSHLRASSYFIGIMFGYIHISRMKMTFGKGKSAFIFMIGLIIAAVTSYSAALFYHTEGVISTSTLARALYGALHRPIWALATGVIVLALSHGRLSLLNNVLGWKPLVPLSKLAYGAFLVHLLVLSYTAGSIRESTYNTHFLMTSRFLGDSVIIFAVALMLYLLVEAPVNNMAKTAANIWDKIEPEPNA